MSDGRATRQDAREWRRRRAWELHQAGCKGKAVAAVLKVSTGAVSGGPARTARLKRVELKIRCCQDLAELRWELGLASRRVRRKRGVLRACFARCGYA